MSRFEFRCPCCNELILFNTVTNEAVHMDPEMIEKEKKEREIRMKRVNTRMQAQMNALIKSEMEDMPGDDPMGFFRRNNGGPGDLF